LTTEYQVTTREGEIMEAPIRNNSFKQEPYYSQITKELLVEWNYRDLKGELHTGISKSIEAAENSAATFGYIPYSGYKK
jgi:hypothetical protein